MSRVEIRFVLTEMPLEETGWPAFREFVDRLVAALGAMPDGPSPTAVLPVRLESGSLSAVFAGDEEMVLAARRLARGLQEDWSADMADHVEPLWNFARERSPIRVAYSSEPDARLYVVHVPKEPPPWEVRQREAFKGEVFRVGGNQGDVELKVPELGVIKGRAGRDTAERLGRLLYRRVRLDCSTRRWSNTKELRQPVDILDIEELPPLAKDPWAALERLSEGVDLDVDKLLAERAS